MVAQIGMDYFKTSYAQTAKRLLSYSMFEGRPLTTKGQWINPLVFAHFSIEKKLPQFKKVEKPVFIVGTGRSGTTILGVLLSMHKQVAFLNEPKALWHSIYPHEDIIGNYSRSDAKFRLTGDDVGVRTVDDAHKLYGAYLRMVSGDRLVDKYPELVFRVPFVKKIFPDAKFIFLIRSGWETCYSINSWSKRLGITKSRETHDWWGANDRKWNIMLEELIKTSPLLSEHYESIKFFTNHSDRASVEWILTMQEGLAQYRSNREIIHCVKYEELTANPVTELQKILDFCELDKNENFFDYALKTLKPAPVHPKFEMDKRLLPIFEQTMKDLGY